MADTKITELAAASGVTADDLIPIVNDPGGTPATQKATAAQVASYVLGGAVTVSAAGRALLDDANASAQRTTLGLAIGTDVQAPATTLAGYGITDAASDTELSDHVADTTSVHGITDTSTLYRSGGTDVALADGGTGASLTDPGADRIMFWDDSAGAVAFLTAGDGLTITGTTIEADGGGGGSIVDIDTTANRPGSPATGELYLDTTLGRMIIYDGTLWRLTAPFYIPATTLVYDTFNRAALGTAVEYGFPKVWAVTNAQAGTTITNGQLVIANSAIFGVNAGVANYTVEFEATSFPSGDAVYCRHSGAGNHNGIGVRNNAGTWEWWKSNASEGSTGLAYSAGQTVKIVVTGTSLTLHIGGSSHTLTDSTFNTNTWFVAVGFTGQTMDNVLIYT
jgi:hypothetical protein